MNRSPKNKKSSNHRNPKDWRLTNQETYLKNKKLTLQKWKHKEGSNWDHDHCEFCFTKFTDKNDIKESLKKGYCTENKNYWICKKCFEDFKERFNWKITRKQ